MCHVFKLCFFVCLFVLTPWGTQYIMKKWAEFQSRRHQKEQVLNNILLSNTASFSHVSPSCRSPFPSYLCGYTYALHVCFNVASPTLVSLWILFVCVSLRNVHTGPVTWHNESKLLKSLSSVLVNDMIPMHAVDKNTFALTEIFYVKWKSLLSIPIATEVAAARERDLPGLQVSPALVCGYICSLLLSSELVIILSWHALFPEYISFHVSLAFSQDLWKGVVSFLSGE